MDRLFRQKLTGTHAEQDAEGFIRMDDWELREDVQAEVMEAGTKSQRQSSPRLQMWMDTGKIFTTCSVSNSTM